MAEQLSTPRITAPYLDNFVNRHVLLIGKVTQLRGDQATLDSDGTVTVLLNRDAHLANGNAVQVIGKVKPDLSIKVLSSKDLGPNIDQGASSPPNHNNPYSSQPAYTPHVALVWSQPDAQPPSPILPPYPSRRSRRSSTSTIFTTTTGYTQTTYNDQSPGHDTRAPSPQPTIPLAYPPSETATSRTYTQPSQSYISPTPHSSQEPDELIPSAQPITPVFPPAAGVGRPFSISDDPSPLPSPPESISDEPSSPAYSRPQSSYGSFRRRRRSSTPAPPATEESAPQARQTTTNTEQPSRSKGTRVRGRGPTRRSPSPQPPPHRKTPDQESLDMSTVLEGIGRMHIAMNQDAAGRWRIKRHESEYD